MTTAQLSRSTPPGHRIGSAPASAAMARSLAAIALGLALLSAGGCAWNAPAVDLTKATLGETSATGAVVDIQLSVISKTDSPLPLRNIEYTVDIPALGAAGKFTGVRAAESTLRAGGVHTLVVPASFATASPIAGGTPFTISGSLYYLEPGQIAAIFYDYNLSRPSIGFSASGTISQGTGPATPMPATNPPAAATKPAATAPTPAPSSPTTGTPSPTTSSATPTPSSATPATSPRTPVAGTPVPSTGTPSTPAPAPK